MTHQPDAAPVPSLWPDPQAPDSSLDHLWDDDPSPIHDVPIGALASDDESGFDAFASLFADDAPVHHVPTPAVPTSADPTSADAMPDETAWPEPGPTQVDGQVEVPEAAVTGGIDPTNFTAHGRRVGTASGERGTRKRFRRR